MENQQDTLKQLFQQEFAKMVAVISSLFGLQHIELAEDIVSETFLTATENWAKRGMPDNPPAWLYAVAKQKTLYHFRRDKIFRQKVLPGIKAGQDGIDVAPEVEFSQQNIEDSQLQMLFAVCTPAIASEAQIGLALRILCGFGIDEIAEAFLSNKETINKRLFRAKEKLRTENVKMEMPSQDKIQGRMTNVLHIIYLLFNEGYYSRTQNQLLQQELCFEAMRLGSMLTGYEKTNLPETNALMALMCFHASRFDARQNNDTALILYDDQDSALWNGTLIRQGMHFLDRSAQGRQLSSYHLEANIAYHHCAKDDVAGKWTEILWCYDQLLLLNYSPAVALNRLFALYKVQGPEAAIREAEKLQTDNNHFYFVLLGELYSSINQPKAQAYLEKARCMAKTATEKEGISRKIDRLQSE